MQEEDEAIGAAIEDAVEVPAVVAPKLAELALDLRAVRNRQVRELVAEQVEPVDLVVDRRLFLLGQRIDELADRLAAVTVPVVDGLEVGHEPASRCDGLLRPQTSVLR